MMFLRRSLMGSGSSKCRVRQCGRVWPGTLRPSEKPCMVPLSLAAGGAKDSNAWRCALLA